MSFSVGAVTLPRVPVKITRMSGVNAKQTSIPADKPIILSMEAVDTIACEGWIAQASSSKTQLKTDYVTPLRLLKNTVVALAYPGHDIDGETALFTKFTVEERPGVTMAFWFSMEFQIGGTYINL